MAYLIISIIGICILVGGCIGIVLAGVGIFADIVIFAVKAGLVLIPLAAAYGLFRVLFC